MPRRFFKQLFALSLLVVIGVGVLFLLSPGVLAQDNSGAEALGLNNTIQETTGLGAEDIRITVAKIIRVGLGLLGIVAVVLMLYAGYEWMTAGGNDEQIESSKKIMRNAVIGLIIILSAYSIASFVISKLLEATTGLPAHCFDGELNYDEGPEADTGGSCGDNVAGGGGSFSRSLYITSLPAPGDACVANFHPVIFFNRSVDITTFVTNTIYVEKTNGGDKAFGTWQYLNPNNKNAVKFVPNGACGPNPEDSKECFESNTNYRLVIVKSVINDLSNIKSLPVDALGVLPLNCNFGKQCGPVEFKTGTAIDLRAPTISIVGPNGSLEAGTVVPVQADFTDDVAVRQVVLNKVGKLIRGETYSGKTGRITSAVGGDYNGDGLTDVIAGTYGTTAYLYFGDGRGKFNTSPNSVSFGGSGLGTAIATGDFTNDGILDLVQGSGFTKNLNVVIGNGVNKKGDGTFKAAQVITFPYAISGLAVADVNKDGFADIVASGYDANQPSVVAVFISNGNGTFRAPVKYNYGTRAGAVALADINADGKIDIVATDTLSKNITVLLGVGDGTFGAPSTAVVLPFTGANTLSVGDLNNDGKPDIAIGFTSPGNKVYVAMGVGNGTFINPQAYSTLGNGATRVVIRDFNADGFADVAASGLYSSNFAILYNKGTGVLLAPDVYALPFNGVDLVVDKLNGDDFPDVVGIAGVTNNTPPALNVFLGAPSEFISSETIEGCVASGRVTLPWRTGPNDIGTHLLNSVAVDVAARPAADLYSFSLLPGTCFNNVLDPGEDQKGPKACGANSVCGLCAGASCNDNLQCAGGLCIAGACVNKPYITDFSPRAAGKDSFVSIKGYYFGTKSGSVSFALKNNPDPNNNADWKQAAIVSCGGYSGWTDRQIIVQVPDGIAATGPIRVITAVTPLVQSFTVTTKDAGLPNFTFTNETLPGICSIAPPSGPAGKLAVVRGKGFEALNSNDDFLLFGQLKSVVDARSWADTQINTTVPNLDSGFVGVTVSVNGKKSNSFEFEVLSGTETGSPIITNITPTSGPRGQYITIEGSGFGKSVGEVWFKDPNTGEALDPSQVFEFPEGICEATDFWRDDRIIAKFPSRVGNPGTSYYVQVQPADRTVNASPIDDKFKFTVTNGTPTPGLCSLSPASGAVPFNPPQVATLKGEYFTADTDVYFAKNGQTAIPTTGALASPKSWSKNVLEVMPSANTITGNVVAYRRVDKGVSNPLPFAAIDCTTQGNQCGSVSERCCVAGPEKGFCKPQGQLCAGETRSTGYIWRFSTKDIPEIPHVVERCDDDGVSLNVTIPSPSPNIRSQALWGLPKAATNVDPQYNVCRTAISFVEFTTRIDQATVKDASNLEVYRCSNFNEDQTCASWVHTDIDATSFTVMPASASRSYLAIQPTANQKGVKQWNDNTLYQVVLKKSIKSLAAPGNSAALGVDAPCDGNGITNSAYCFQFRTDSQDCSLRAVLVTPYQYFTTYLEDPMLYHDPTGEVGGPVPYTGNGLSTQRCVMMDVSNYSWQWATEKPNNVTYAEIHDGANSQRSHVSSFVNTKGVVPKDSVEVRATASMPTQEPKTGVSPLTIDLSNPEVVEAWPNCLEACTNATVGVRFNMTMNNKNLPGAPANGTVQLLECEDENCQSTVSVFTVNSIKNVHLSEPSNYTVLNIANNSKDPNAIPALKPNTKYKVVLSAEGDPEDNTLTNQMWASYRYGDPSLANLGKKYNKVYTWTFKTKKEACQIDRVEVAPKNFFAQNINDRSIFSAQPYSAPDACSASGQKLNPWLVNWKWQPADNRVAEVQTFSSKTGNPNCTAACIRKGSDVPFGNTSPLSICGNGVIEAGEDCDAPDAAKGCSLDCRYMGSVDATCGNGKLDRDPFYVKNGYGEECDPKDPATMINCSADCRHIGSDAVPNPNNPNLSICGNGLINGKVGNGEDCDVGVPADLNNPLSSMGCSNRCLHVGTSLSKKWCQINQVNGSFGGFVNDKGLASDEFTAACGNALSICGDGLADNDEDPFCESLGGGKVHEQCDNTCLLKQGNTPADVANGNTCGNNPNSIPEGCNEDFQHVGSSVLYSTPSVCGDGLVGTGEDAVCEAGLSGKALTFDPWALAKGVGQGPVDVQKNPPEQSTAINASTNELTKNNATVNGSGNFTIQCGYKSDLDCLGQGIGLGVGSDSCCYARPEFVSAFPVTSTPIQRDVCPNTYLAATFNQKMDVDSLPGNILIATGTDEPCAPGTIDVSDKVFHIAGNNGGRQIAWYQSVYRAIANFVRTIFGLTVEAKIYPDPVHWCVGNDVGTPTVEDVPERPGYSRIVISLDKPLATESNYAVILEPGVKSERGVSFSSRPINWMFTTASRLCEVNSVTVSPSQVLFSTAGSTTTLLALGAYVNPRGATNYLQQIPGYYNWNFNWGPVQNNIVSFSTTTSDATTTLAALNRNGELEVRAAANITENTISASRGIVATGDSQVTVFLCENPWPPKAQLVNGSGPFVVFPYEDKADNNDDYDPVVRQFNNQPIPPTEFLSDGYFNFRTYYCADAGGLGTADDLPYLRPAVQTSTKALAVLPNTCALTGSDLNGGTCSTDADCGFKYTTTTQMFVGEQTSLCATVVNGNPTYYTKDNKALSCAVAADCDKNAGFVAFKANNPGSTTGCVGAPSNAMQNKCYHHRPLKRFFFTSDRGDTVGLQVFENRDFLTATEWFEGDVTRGGQGFIGNITTAKIDGYNAATDGNNYYIEALNLASSTNPLTGQVTNNLYGTIYLLSINADARPETRQVFNAMRDNLSLNTNLTSYGYCGKTVNTPGFEVQCSTDLDCPGGQVCSNQKAKLQRNYVRLRNAQTIENLLHSYFLQNGFYPRLEAGSFLAHQTVSTWPQSWTLLGNQLSGGSSLPVDPVNLLGPAGTCASNTAKFCTTDGQCGNKPAPHANVKDTCILHDPITGWSAADRRFSFACATSSLAYRYNYVTTTNGYELRLKMEDISKKIDNINDLSSIFDPHKKLVISDTLGICTNVAEISSIDTGFCGDGVVNINRGEACDPLRSSQRYGSCGALVPNQIKVDVCNKSCQWIASTTQDQFRANQPSQPGFIFCASLSVCGNGVKEIGEVCDQGVLNGAFNSCNKTCDGFTNLCGNNKSDAGELCEITDVTPNSTKKGWCVGGINNGKPCNVGAHQECNLSGNQQTFSGVCVDTKVEGVKYSRAQSNSCGFDCRSRGPYCGDGVVQAEFGEECDGNDNNCPVGGINGVRTCSAECKYADAEASVWFNFNDALVSPNNTVYSNSGALSALTATCDTLKNCPKFGKSSGVNSTGAVAFDAAQQQFLSVAHDDAIMSTSSFSIEMWLYMKNYPADSARILEKGGWEVGPGYDLEMWSWGVRYILWRDSVSDGMDLFSSDPVPLNKWTHVVITYDKQMAGQQKIQTARIYIGGKMSGEKITINEPDWFTENNSPLYIGKAASPAQSLYFSGVIDNFRYYRRALQPAEVVDHAGNPWVCRAELAPLVATAPKEVCGDGKVSAKEACDKAGDNGKVCDPRYNQACTYCSKDCAVVTVEPKQFCGNGIIEASEKCDTDPATGIIYSVAKSVTSTEPVLDQNGHNGYKQLVCSDELTDPYTAKAGTKSCNACQSIISKETGVLGCAVCGLISSGEKVSGEIINVLGDEGTGPIYNNSAMILALRTQIDSNNARVTPVALRAYNAKSSQTYTLSPPYEDAFTSTVEAEVSSEAICSDPNAKSRYVLFVNSVLGPQNPNYINLKVEADPRNLKPWRYDLVLSPMISKNGHGPVKAPNADYYDNLAVDQETNNYVQSGSARPGDIRMVVSWKGEGSLVGGILIPGVGVIEGSGFEKVGKDREYFNLRDATNVFLPAGVVISRDLGNGRFDSRISSVWYHGQNNTQNNTHAFAFTFDTFISKHTSYMATPQYAFFIRTADNSPITNFSARDLKVEVYYPEENTSANGFDRPLRKVIEFSGALESNNRKASYWHVANVSSVIGGVASVYNRIMPARDVDGSEAFNGRIISSSTQIRF